jgi:hypothetical protein
VIVGDVLAVLEDGEEQIQGCLAAAVEIAERDHARLTLAKTTDPGRLVRWLCPFAVGTLYLPAQISLEAGHTLARAAEFVPQDIPLTTVLLSDDTQRELVRLLRAGRFGAVVAGAPLLARGGPRSKLNRELGRLGLDVVPVVPAPPQRTPVEIGARI